MKIKELKELREKMIVVDGISVSGKIEKIYERTAGKSQYGDYSFQNILISDDTDKILVNFNNRAEITDDHIEQVVNLNSKFSEKMNRNIGVKIVKEDYVNVQGEETSIVKVVVSGNADVKFGEVTENPVTPIKEVIIKEIVPAKIELKNCLKEGYTLLKEINTELGTMIDWGSEDIRAVGITLYLDRKRK